MSNVCRTASAREKSRERMTIIAASQPLRGGQQAPAFQVAKMASKKPQRKENNPEASASSQQSVSAAETKSTSGLLMLQRERRHFECVQNSECKREVAICVYEISVCAATRKKTKCVSRRRPQPKNVPQKTKEGNNKDASATTQHSGQRC